MRIEILLDKRNAVPAHLIQSLEVRLKHRILPLYPDMQFRIAQSSQTTINISGVKSPDDKQSLMDTIQSIWEDDSWMDDDNASS
ncbi:DinI family protein [Morganella morganii]|uniref:DinI family protein n=1 Tax=Morganella morganii TaxID=582 RepID=A0A433ZS78_MORMO|nr:DinI-like family protein [Morganella morganii]RUT64990.1 DinI family protein [Morganella morganii]